MKDEGLSRDFLVAELLTNIYQVVLLNLVGFVHIYLSYNRQKEMHILVGAALRILFQDLYHRLKKKFKASNCLPEGSNRDPS